MYEPLGKRSGDEGGAERFRTDSVRHGPGDLPIILRRASKKRRARGSS